MYLLQTEKEKRFQACNSLIWHESQSVLSFFVPVIRRISCAFFFFISFWGGPFATANGLLPGTATSEGRGF